MKRKRHQPSEPQESGRTVVTKRRRRRLRKLGLAALATSCIMTAYSPLSSSASEDPTYPGLPDQNTFRGGWVSPSASVINEARKAKQWVRLPPLAIAAYNFGSVRRDDTSPLCDRLGGYKSLTDYKASLYFVSGDEKSPHPYGYVRAFDVHAVAFGTIPVTATVRLAQPRDSENLPIGGTATQKTGEFCPPGGPFTEKPPGGSSRPVHIIDTDVRLATNVEVVDLSVDGVHLGLRPGCRTSAPSEVVATAAEYYGWDPSVSAAERPSKETVMTTKYFTLAVGGLLTGSVDIGAFADCTTPAGEDVSPLLTNVISGQDNKVVLRAQGLEVSTCMATPRDCEGNLPSFPFPDTN